MLCFMGLVSVGWTGWLVVVCWVLVCKEFGDGFYLVGFSFGGLGV